jgi:dTDP-4-amino-4,6-dideoxygalactose transaminase
VTQVNVPLVDLKAQYREIKHDVAEAIHGVLDRTDFILGADVQELEKEYAAFVGAAEAVAVDSGISALELGMRALGIGPGDEVITPANSFIASSSAISFTGATPVWVDVDPKTYNITAETVAVAITPRTKAIMPVHLYGQTVDIDPILALAHQKGLMVVEDACQAHGAHYGDRLAGSLGEVAAFSFYPGKNLGAYGDAGMLTTNSAELAERVRMIRNYGQRQKYDHTYLAWNRRMDTIQAAILRVKLRRLVEWTAARQRIASLYDELLADAPVVLPTRDPKSDHVFHLYVIQVDNRDDVLAELQSRGIGAGIHYPIPIHLQAAYRDRGFGPGSFPVTEAAAPRLLSLPLYPEMTDEQVRTVAGAVIGACRSTLAR